MFNLYLSSIKDGEGNNMANIRCMRLKTLSLLTKRVIFSNSPSSWAGQPTWRRSHITVH